MSGTEVLTPARPPAPLGRNRNFLLLWLGVGVSVLGDRAATVAFPLVTIWYGGSTTEAGYVGFAGLLPMLLVQLPAGVLVDRLDRRRTMIACDVAGLLAMASLGIALCYGRLWLPHIMVVAFVEGTASIFYRLAERAAVRNVVHADHVAPALSRNEARARAAGLVGQPIGTSLYGVVRWSPFLFAAVSHLCALVSLLAVRATFQAERPTVSWRLRADVAEGFRWLVRQRFLGAAISLVAVTNVLFQALSLSLVLIVRENGGSPMDIGLIGLVSGIGGIAGALSGSRFVARTDPGVVMIGIFAVWAALMPMVALTGNVLVLAMIFAGTSFAGAILNVVAGIYQVQVTPDAMQGRVGSVAGLMTSGASSLGALGGGFALSAVGSTRTVLAVGGVMLVVCLTAVSLPAVRGARRLRDDAVPGHPPGP